MRRYWPLFALILTMLVVVSVWLRPRLERSLTRRAPARTRALAVERPTPRDPADAGVARSAPPRRADRDAAPAETCAPDAARLCFEGDVWSLDGCGQLEQKRRECGAQLCRGDRCEAPDRAPCRAPEQGVCEGARVVACVGGRREEVDCAAQGLACRVGAEGAECLPPIPPGLRCEGEPRCEGQMLVTCVAGHKVFSDCAALGGRCSKLAGAASRCVKLAPPSELPCGPCGCREATARVEVQCDARDEDASGFADDELDCGPVPVVAFLVTGEGGEGSHAEEDVLAEIARTNAVLASSEVEHPPQLELVYVVPLPDSSLLTIDDEELALLLVDPRVQLARDAFYVPLVLTDRLAAGGGVPKVGTATLPNGTCGKVQRGQGPELGVIVVSKTRSPTTVAHELGHFLGLCHTQDVQPATLVMALDDPYGPPRTCPDRCDGDGLCDTPEDPGPPTCEYSASCDVHCPGGEDPDASNVMSYYTACRERFSDDQVRLMQESLALRRAWHPCRGGRCPCSIGPSPSLAPCPVGMSCRPMVQGGTRSLRCSLDGPTPAGQPCAEASTCGHGTLCIHTARGGQRCARTCSSDSPSCSCVEVHELLSVCLEDLGPDS